MLGTDDTDKITIKNSPIYAAVTFWLLFVATNADLNGSQIIWWGSVGLFIGVFLLTYQMKIRLNNYALWICAFAVISLSSALWAINSSLVFNTMKSMFVQIVVLVILHSSIRSRNDIEFLLKLVLFTCVLNAAYLVCTNRELLTQQASSASDRLGDQEGWNANGIGMMASISVMLSLYFLKRATTWSGKILYTLFIVFLAFISLITGSRKAVVILMGGMAAYIFLSSNGKRIRSLFSIVLILSLIWYLIVETPYFYAIIGWRVEAFLSQFTGKGELDSSAENRKILIVAAIDAWKERPILGHGLDCFRYFGKIATGMDYYAHNNYVEILADLGIVGFTVYYCGYAYALVKSWKYRQNKLSLLLFVLLCVLLVIEYACVTYTDFYFEVIIMLLFANARFGNKENSYE